ncbi:DNA-3-methyladenine glycosylase [Trinickia caryophylli]|uniref:DNA-3-methyladenine glycosylase II n=1 Tax=Trinickia caryophylli TaxID=28094 RepID=A0A1X7DGR5_TRICW|nr:DNA-3-methyladenine glycosylase [Trinickia caryophylli]PMS12363.1 DNA-3-methyladenine glycosylase [Trinickia caryophylli]TRX16963.1 DNA-3-methyladenine glycosylase 2 family protein [Trinickia caryophylli]WQE12301.1 DNA-3-methyladenine glycosylase [Trinickia caryophylli]SMF15311.1 DNA-3-methyladenine glycosylase II [Trinickia caryophylli]GLU31553.1 base excision DNA repair protein [Trinickia caryophylli]
MATARKAPAKRAAPQRFAAATKTARGRGATAPASGNGIDDEASKKRSAAARRVSNGAAGAKPKAPAARGSKAKGNGALPDAGADERTLVADPVHEGEMVRKARTGSSAKAAVPVQIGGLTPEVTRPAYWDRACADLVRRDRILKRLIPQFGPVHLINGSDPFVTLARAVVGQQISVPAAQAVWERIELACPKLAPQQFTKAGIERLTGCGLSKRKSEYLIDLAQHFVSGALHVDKWMSMDDEAVIAELTQIRGIGRWTAEMFLIFNLSRPDVLPLDDLGLIRAISVNYFSGEPVTRSEAREVAANWEPWRTVATWYMWRSLDAAPAQ